MEKGIINEFCRKFPKGDKYGKLDKIQLENEFAMTNTVAITTTTYVQKHHMSYLEDNNCLSYSSRSRMSRKKIELGSGMFDFGF